MSIERTVSDTVPLFQCFQNPLFSMNSFPDISRFQGTSVARFPVCFFLSKNGSLNFNDLCGIQSRFHKLIDLLRKLLLRTADHLKIRLCYQDVSLQRWYSNPQTAE